MWNLGVIVVLLLVGATAAWLLVPTIRTFGGPSFEPMSADDASVFWAQQSGVIQGSGRPWATTQVRRTSRYGALEPTGDCTPRR